MYSGIVNNSDKMQPVVYTRL